MQQTHREKSRNDQQELGGSAFPVAADATIEEIHLTFLQTLFRAKSSPRKIFILIDHLDRIEVEEVWKFFPLATPFFPDQTMHAFEQNAKSDWWIPREVPTNVTFVTTSVEGNLGIPWNNAPVKPVLPEESKKIIERGLAAFGKALDTAQMAGLISKEGAKDPVWLSLACEELRVFGVFEKLSEKIENLPGDLASVVRHIFSRIKSEIGVSAHRFISLIAASHSGILETEMAVLLTTSSAPLPQAELSLIRNSFTAFLSDESDKLTFSHRAVQQGSNIFPKSIRSST